MPVVVSILFTLLATNLPILAYAWLYMHVPNLIAAALYFGLSIALCLVGGQIVGALRKREPEQGFGCLAVVTFVPGILIGLFLLVPVLQLRLKEPAVGISVSQLDAHRGTQFYSFEDPILAGPLSYWHREKRSRRSGSSTTHYTEHFQVMPILGPDWTKEKAPQVWLTSADESRAFDKEPKKIEQLSALELVKPDRGLKRAIKRACEEYRIPEPEAPLLLEQTLPFAQELDHRQQRLLTWLGPYNLITLVLILMATLPRPKSAKVED